MKVGQGLVVRQDQHVQPTVIVEIADCQAAAHPRDRPGDTGPVGDIGQAAVDAADQELCGHLVRVIRPQVVHVAVGRGQVEPTVIVGVEEGDSEAQQPPAGNGQADGGRRVDEVASAQIAVERGRLAVEVGDGQVDQPVAVEVARGDAHAGLIGPRGIAGHAGSVPDLLEPHPADVAEQEVGRGVVGDEKVHPAIVVEVGGDHPEAAAVAVDDTSLRRHIDEPARVIAEQVVGQSLGIERIAVE